MLASEILRAAQQKIVKHGWIRGESGNDEKGYCMYGALNQVIGADDTEEGREAYWNLLKILRIDGYPESITLFNDGIAKDQSEVIEVFNRAIQHVKLKERA